MKTEVIANDDRSEEDARRLSALGLAVYGPQEERDDDFARITWAPTEISVIVRSEDGKSILAHAGALARDGLLDGNPVRIGGVGGVKTHPDVRGQHLGRQVVARATELLRDELGVDFGLLVCEDRLLPYYQQLGWQAFAGELWIDQPQGRVRFEFNKVMVTPGRLPAPGSGVIDLLGFPW